MAGVISIGELRGIITLSDQFSGPLDKVAKALGVSSASLTAVGQAAGLAIGAVTAATAAIVALGSRGAEVADVRSAFDGFAESAGASADIMLGKLREGTLGTISNFDLMKLANKALGAGLIKSSEDMGTLAQGAQLLADRTGGDTKEAFETLTSTIASGRTAQLKQLGLFVDTKVAVGNYAASIHKSVGDLTDAERAQGLSQGTLAALRSELDKNGKAQADFGDNVQKAKVFVQNFTDNLGEAIATSPVVSAAMDGIGAALSAAFGDSSQDAVQTLSGYVDRFAIFLVQAGQVAVDVARVMSNAWNGTKFLFQKVMEGITDALGFVNRAIAATIESAAAIPGAPAWIKDMAKTARSAADDIQIMSASFHQQAEETLDSASAANHWADTVKGSLAATEAEMRKQLGAHALVQKAHRDTGQAAVASANASVESAKKIADMYTSLQNQLAVAQTTGIDQRLLELEQAREKEIAGVDELKNLSVQKHDEMVALIDERYDLMGQKVTATSQEILDTTRRLQEELAIANTTGTEARLLEIDIAHERELESVRKMTEGYGEEYDELVALTNEKYAAMRAVVELSQAGIVAAANAAGFQTRAQLQETADRAKQLYDAMLASGQFTFGELEKAHAAWIKAKEDLDEKSHLSTLQKFELLASSASSLIRSIFGKSKAAAIAAAIIDTAAAVVKALSAYPWPFNLAPAAAAFAAGIAQVNTIRNTDYSARTGSPGTRFEDFGRGTEATLHGREAVITELQAASVAGMVGSAIEKAQGGAGGNGGTIAQFTLMAPSGEVWDRFLMRRDRAGFLTLSRSGG